MASTANNLTTPAEVSVRRMREEDLPAAGTIFRLAFGTFIGVPDPQNLWPDRDYIRTRWIADSDAAFTAEVDGTVVGSNFATNWGSFAFFGPLTVHPERWNQGIAQRLLAPTMDLFESWKIRYAGLFTFAQSPKHVSLYQKFGFWPRFLTALMWKTPGPGSVTEWLKYSNLTEDQREQALRACAELTGSILEGLDVRREILAIHSMQLGETVLLWRGDSLEAFACCQCGEGTEAGAGRCYIKFGAVRRGANADQVFDHLLDACEALATERRLERVDAGVNTGRGQAYRAMLGRGF